MIDLLQVIMQAVFRVARPHPKPTGNLSIRGVNRTCAYHQDEEGGLAEIDPDCPACAELDAKSRATKR